MHEARFIIFVINVCLAMINLVLSIARKDVIASFGWFSATMGVAYRLLYGYCIKYTFH